VNKIAAGEVVERPASVVKELLENAIDAGAETVAIDLKDAGRQLIRLVDDGTGMPREDLLLALERHATSKISTEADLESIVSLGFRGEALAAVCSVSRFSIYSRARGEERGGLVRGEGGSVLDRLEVDGAEGTTVEITDLFFNVPARLKFLKSPQTELAASLRVVSQLALALPGLQLRVTHNGKPLLAAPRSADLRDRIGALMGFGLAEKLLQLRRQERGITVSGLITPPALSRGSREEMTIIVNGRPVRDALLTQTLLDAYRPLLPRDQFPVAVILLELDSSAVDVNVHPTKAWVRFRHPRLVQEILFATVQEALKSPEVVSSVGSSHAALGTALPQAATGTQPLEAGEQGRLFQETPVAYGGVLFGEVVGQLQETFVVSASAEEVFFIDQHVAHERVLFERLKAELGSGPLPAQELLFPQTLELSPSSRALLADWRPTLEQLGFSLDAFGGSAVLLRAVPVLLKEEEPRRLVEALVDEVGPLHRGRNAPVLDRALAFVACRAAVKAHQSLNREEMAGLLSDLSATATPYFCPHGRPIISRLPLREIKRELKRTW
jgi:DNA mismatch repair protein MutL